MTRRRRLPHRLPDHALRVARWPLCMQLLLVLLTALPAPKPAGKAEGTRFVVCSVQGMTTVWQPAEPTADGAGANQSDDPSPTAPDGPVAAGSCPLCQARLAMAPPPPAALATRTPPLLAPDAPLAPGLAPPAPRPWRPLHPRAPPASA